MDLDEFSESLGEAGARLAALVDEALASDTAPSPEIVRRLLQELSTGMEELRVAEEELIVQADQLAASHDAIDRERERYGRLFDFAPDGYVETDELGKILEANAAASSLLGVAERLLVGKLLVAFIDDADRRPFRRAVAEAPKGSPSGELQVTMVPRSGEPFRAGLRVATDPMSAPGETRLRWLIRDISERVRLEAERQALQEDLDVMLAMSELTRLTSGGVDLDQVLAGIVDVARGVVDGSISITLADRRRDLTTATASDEVAARLSDLQYTVDGPCRAAAVSGTPFEAATADLPASWLSLREALFDAGFVAVLAIPLVVDGAPVGAVNVYAARALSDADREALRLLGDQASAAVGNAQLYTSTSELVSQLSTALESRAVIEQAKGVLMALQHCDEDEAFDILRRASQRSNRKLRDVAAELIAGARSRRGPSPPPPPPRRPRS